MRKKSLVKGQKLEDWVQVDANLYCFKDKNGVVWELLRTPYTEIPITTFNQLPQPKRKK